MKINLKRQQLSRVMKRAVGVIVAAGSITMGSSVAAGASAPTLSAVTNLAVSQVANTSFHAAWSIPGNEVTLSAITLAVTSGANTTDVSLAPNATSYDVTGLAPNTNYTVTVIATDTSFPPLTAGAAANVKTLKNPATAVSAFTAVPDPSISGAMDLSWTAPSYLGSGLSGYTVSCTPSCTIATQPDANATSLVVTGLTTTNSYVFSIVANTTDGQAGAPSTANGYFAPSAPSNIQVTQATLSTVLLTWSAPSYLGAGLSGYTVSCSPACTIATQPAANATSLLVTGLSYGQNYTFSVVAKASDQQTSVAGTASGSTSSTIGSVQNLNVTAPTATSVSASWSAPAGSANYVTFYKVYCLQGSTSCGSATVPASNSPTVTFTSSQQFPIIPTTSYTLYVLAYAVNGSSSPSYASASVSTPVSLNPAPSAVTSLSATNITASSITINWVAPANLAQAGILNGYTVTCSPTCTIPSPPGPSATSLTISGLSSATRYTFTVVANSANLKNSAPAQFSADTNFLPVTGLSASALSTTSVHLSWTAPVAGTVSLKGYTISCTPSCTIATQPGANATSFNVSGLSAGVNYSFAIVATGTDNQLSASASASTTTNYLAPGAVTGLTAVAQSSTSVLLNWTAPAQKGSGLSGYSVSCTPSCTIATQPDANATSLLITGLAAGTSYTFSIVVNASDSQTSAAAVAYSVGNISSGSSSLVTSTSASLSWSAPSASLGGVSIANYVYVCTPQVGAAVLGSSLSASALLTGLNPNTQYSCLVTARDSSGNTSVTSSAITFTTMHVAPGAVTGFSATVQSTTSVLLNWTAPSEIGAGLSGYTVSCTSTCTIATQPSSSDTSLLVTGLTPGASYTFSIVTNATDSQSSVAATSVGRAIPSAPINAAAVAQSATSVLVSWTAPAQVGAGLSGYTVSCTPSCTIATQPGANATSLLVTGLNPGKAYTFSIIANASGTQSSAAVTATASTPYLAPGSVTGVAAVAQSTSSVLVSWTAPAQVGAGLSGYTVSCTPSCIIATQPGANVTSLLITGLSAGTSYSFSVIANASDGQSSAAASATARTQYTAPDAVGSLSGTAVGMTQVQLSWTAPIQVGAGLSGYTVSCTPSCTIATQPGANATTLLITGLSAGTSYTFSVIANASDSQQSSAAVSGAISTASTPGQIVGPVVRASTTSASITWQAPAGSGTAIIAYAVICTPTCGATQNLPGSATSVQLTGLLPNSSYVVSIIAEAIGGNSTSSVNVSTTFAAPGAVTGLTATAQSTSSVILNWTAAAANGSASLSGYTVSCTPSCTIATQPGANATSLQITGLLAGKNYSFSVIANASDSQSSAAATATARTNYAAPGAVSGLAATVQPTSSVLLNWTAAAANGSASLSGYTVSCTPSCTIATQPGANATSLLITGLSAGTSYSFSVIANASDSQFSTAATATARTNYAAPGAVTGLTAKQTAAGTAVLSWKAPVNVGSGIASYKVTYMVGGKSVSKSVTSLSITLTGLGKGAQNFSVSVLASNALTSTANTVGLSIK